MFIMVIDEWTFYKVCTIFFFELAFACELGLTPNLTWYQNIAHLTPHPMLKLRLMR